MQRSTTRNVAGERGASAESSWSPSTVVRKPTRPKLIPNTGVPVPSVARRRAAWCRPRRARRGGRARRPRARRARRRRGGLLLDAPPRLGDHVGAAGRSHDGDPAGGSVTSPPTRRRDGRRTPGSPSARGAGTARRRARGRPTGRSATDLVDDPAVHLRVADDPALAHVGGAGLELRLDEDERTPRPASAQASAGGSALPRPMKETSQTTNVGRNGRSSQRSSRTFVRSSTVTRGSSRSFGWSWP